jgi:hypothetical protein
MNLGAIGGISSLSQLGAEGNSNRGASPPAVPPA